MQNRDVREEWELAWHKAGATSRARRLIVDALAEDPAGKSHSELARIIRSAFGSLCDDSVTCLHRQDASATSEWDHRLRSAEQAEARAGTIRLNDQTRRWIIDRRIATPPHSPTLLERGAVYRRQDLHGRFGGQEQGGISTPAKKAYILLFTGESGRLYGYEDRWESDGTFHYTGEGQVGDMKMEAGNAAVANHSAAGKDLELFATLEEGCVRFMGQMICAGYEFAPGMKDRLGQTRTGIVFRLVPGETPLEYVPTETPDYRPKSPPQGATPRSAMAFNELRTRAIGATELPASSHDYRRSVYERSDAVRQYVLARSKGNCEECASAAPFNRPDGTPYLEPHHVEKLSDGGPDHPYWVIALCPNCHRRAHYAIDSVSFNSALAKNVREIEDRLEQGFHNRH